MKLWIVVNNFLRTDKFIQHEHKFEKAVSKLDVDYEIVTNDQCMALCSTDCVTTGKIPANDDPVLFWDKDIRLGKALEYSGHRLFNSTDAIQLCDDKTLTALAIGGRGLKIPHTVIAPMTYSGIGYPNIDFVDYIVDRIGFPMIVKEAFGSFGAQVYKCTNYYQLLSIIKQHGDNQLLFQENIDHSLGRDVRIQVVGENVVSAMYRYSDNGDFRANISNGGCMKAYEPNDDQRNLAINSVKDLGLDFAGVDILFGNNNEPVLCEVNSNAHFINIDNCTGSDVAFDIIKYILEKCS